jgi:tRNA pseudouridine38-40 synthase
MTVAVRYALKIAYDGTRFSGSQRQPEVRTVDGECLFVLKKNGAVEGPQESHYQSASRTDRGVSAIGNVIAFNTDMGKDALLGSFNSAAKDVWAWALAAVPDSFNARKAAQRWYRYLFRGDLDEERAKAAAEVFQGRHDFKRFTLARTNTVRVLDSLEVMRVGPFLCLDIKGQSFLWGMVRRIAAAIQLYCRGGTTLRHIEEVLAGGEGDFGRLPPEPLILMDVYYGFEFDSIPSKRARAEISRRLLESQLELARWTLFANRLGTG